MEKSDFKALARAEAEQHLSRLKDSPRVNLGAKTRDGKNHLHQSGTTWVVVQRWEHVFFSSEKDWVLLMSETNPVDLRWVRVKGDQNFEVLSDISNIPFDKK